MIELKTGNTMYENVIFHINAYSIASTEEWNLDSKWIPKFMDLANILLHHVNAVQLSMYGMATLARSKDKMGQTAWTPSNRCVP
jgi:hypothetical protein